MVSLCYISVLQFQLAKMLQGQISVQTFVVTTPPQSTFPYPTQPLPPPHSCQTHPPFPSQLLPPQPQVCPVWISPPFGRPISKWLPSSENHFCIWQWQKNYGIIIMLFGCAIKAFPCSEFFENCCNRVIIPCNRGTFPIIQKSYRIVKQLWVVADVMYRC